MTKNLTAEQLSKTCKCIAKTECMQLTADIVSNYVLSDEFQNYIVEKLYPWLIVALILAIFLMVISIILAINQLLILCGFHPLRHYLPWDCYRDDDLEEKEDKYSDEEIVGDDKVTRLSRQNSVELADVTENAT